MDYKIKQKIVQPVCHVRVDATLDGPSGNASAVPYTGYNIERRAGRSARASSAGGTPSSATPQRGGQKEGFGSVRGGEPT